MNTIQDYYGMAIRQNKGQLYAMKKSVCAILYHCSANEDNEDPHKYCPRSAESWCKYQADKITGKKEYKTKINISKAIHELMKPIFKDLSSDELLKKCTHGETQNANEALKKLVWQDCPEDNFVSRPIVEIATVSAVIHFNDGAHGISDVLSNLEIKPGMFTIVSSRLMNKTRTEKMNKKSTEKGKNRQKKLRSVKKDFRT